MNPNETYKGLTFCDLGQGIAAPHATMLFAQHGANVVKVEPPEGDWVRTLGEPHGDQTASSLVYNLGKRSITVDLKSAAGKDTIHKLIAASDVFVESFRPGVITRLGLSYDEVRAINPKIIYASLSGFGQTGPYSKRGTVDALVQGFSGMMVMNQAGDGVPRRQNMTAVDVLSGLYLFAAIAMAIERRHRSGEGGFIDLSLMQAAASFQSSKILDHHITDGKAQHLYMPAGMLEASDGAIVISTMRHEHWVNLCEGLQCPGLVDDLRFAEKAGRLANGDVLMQELSAASRRFTVDQLLERLQALGVFCERLLDYGQWMQDRHVQAAQAYEWVDAPGFGRVPLVAFPGSQGHPRAGWQKKAPHIGEHTEEVLRELG